MQCAHPGKSSPQRHAGIDEALTKTIEQGSGLGPAQALAHRPDVQLDDFSPERTVEAQSDWGQP